MQCSLICKAQSGSLISSSARRRLSKTPAKLLVSRRPLVVRAHEDDDVLPIFRLPHEGPHEELQYVPPSHLQGGTTFGDELTIIHNQYLKAEDTAVHRMEESLYSSNWQGDVYVGSNWNIMTVLMAIMFLTPIFGLLFAYLSYGTLWTGHYIQYY